MVLGGPLSLQVSGLGQADGPRLALQGKLTGQLQPGATGVLASAPSAAKGPIRLVLDAELSVGHLLLRQAEARLGEASATAQLGARFGAAGWQAQGQARLVNFDPRPWWRGPAGSAWQRGPHRLQGDLALDLRSPLPLDRLWSALTATVAATATTTATPRPAPAPTPPHRAPRRRGPGQRARPGAPAAHRQPAGRGTPVGDAGVARHRCAAHAAGHPAGHAHPGRQPDGPGGPHRQRQRALDAHAGRAPAGGPGAPAGPGGRAGAGQCRRLAQCRGGAGPGAGHGPLAAAGHPGPPGAEPAGPAGRLGGAGPMCGGSGPWPRRMHR